MWSYPFLVSLLFGVPLSLHLVTFIMFFNLLYSVVAFGNLALEVKLRKGCVLLRWTWLPVKTIAIFRNWAFFRPSDVSGRRPT